jgi:glutamate synthase domain-containing protein 2
MRSCQNHGNAFGVMSLIMMNPIPSRQCRRNRLPVAVTVLQPDDDVIELDGGWPEALRK